MYCSRIKKSLNNKEIIRTQIADILIFKSNQTYKIGLPVLMPLKYPTESTIVVKKQLVYYACACI